MQREAMEFDVLIVVGGPAGLAAAIRLKQYAARSSALITHGAPLTRCTRWSRLSPH
jgi:electron-transferring-flavoprotein dehydrogenase